MTRPYILRKGVSYLRDLADGALADLPYVGSKYFLDPTNGNDSNSGTESDKAFKSWTVAYAALTADQHDVLFYISGTSSLTLSAAATWAKSYTHFVGLCAPTRVAQRSRIFQLSTLTAASPLLNITGSGCIFKDFYIFQGVADNTSLINVQVTGDRNYFGNVHFAGGGHATQAIDGGASLKLDAGYENCFVGCTIGIDTIAAATGMAGVLFDSASGRNEFYDCTFLLYAGHIGAKFVEVVDNAGFDRYILFDNCRFINDATDYTLTEAITVPSGMGSDTHRIICKDCVFLGVTDIEGSNRGIVYANMGAITAGGNSGLMQATNTT